MKRFIFVLALCCCFGVIVRAAQWIRVNQLGYLTDDVKVAVWVSNQPGLITSFQVINELTGKPVYTGKLVEQTGKQLAFATSARLNFSSVSQPGTYFIQAGEAVSPAFRISNDVYAGTADVPLKYMRQQRCGYNPFLKDSCHRADGRIVCSPEGKRDGEYVDVRGGWHDASDYLQYVATSANAVYQMLFAYSRYPDAFGDEQDANGEAGANGIPDILDEAKWGLDWLVRMNPDSDTYFNQLADDRDHARFVLPTEQKVDYGWGEAKERPVYFCSPEPQGLKQNKNRSTGLASTMGKYASSFSLGAEILVEYYPEFAGILRGKALDAYRMGVKYPGVCQTAPCVSPYFYEEDNWVDDMELAAAELFSVTQEDAFLQDAVNYGRMEPVTPWMGADSARHYQWYPFINLGHYRLAVESDGKVRNEFIRNLKSGLQRVKERAQGDAFMNGIPFIWCSNNLTVALITQCNLYRDLTGDNQFQEMETAMRDWLFGCNPWGKCMIIGLPEHGDYPQDPHSAFTALHNYPITGGLVDGPIYAGVFNNLRGVHLSREDKYASFQSSTVVYHDDWADYSTNEPTMDGTASLCYYLGYLSSQANRFQKVQGGIVRGKTNEKKLSLVFTGHGFADGYSVIRKALKKNKINGAFFLTGDFCRKYPDMIKALQKDGHYIAPHSDKHLLYADWDKRDSTLISHEAFLKDLEDNYEAIRQAGLEIEEPRYFLPSYEWYNRDITGWCDGIGVQVINFTPGTYSNADYTTPDMEAYRSSDEIYCHIMNYEKQTNLNGFLLLTHIGTDARRTDKFYNYLDKLIKELKDKGYSFVSVEELLKTAR